MKTRVLVILSLLVGIGAVLHAVVPPILFGMKPDMLLSMMFLGIILFPKPKYVILLATVTGIMSALTTSVPGGQIANVIDKPVTAFLFLAVYLIFGKRFNENISVPILTAIGTIISGTVFLSVALYIVGLMEGGFLALFIGIVLPAALVNTLVMIVIYPIVTSILKRTQPITTS
ncbi:MULTISPECIES: tryptophan transporter [unclassified Virgibacillus]|uniref:tryptophan transporter n=1 Tax=unclassified Virgibacillus TaxID=2620237 RepID=UPI0024DEEEEB|nr:tryptophan transporter [Virgibacillus sp. LDC-1]